MINVQKVWTTSSPEVIGHGGSGNSLVKPAEAGSGVAAGGAVRIVMDMAGISDVTSKSLGSNTPINVVRATIDGLKKLRTSEEVAKLRQPERA